jgi:alpha-N-arabinofuranosidase
MTNLKMKSVLLGLGLAAVLPMSAEQKASITVYSEQGKRIIPKEIYGQFAEHLGTCIYGGLWVGEDSEIPNTQGYRNDVLEALKELKVPVLRWPGGCFADVYHWTDGIGPKEQRPKLVNTNWGGTVEDNSFGTHEFFNLCELLGCEPYLSGNVGSGTVDELAKWVEYITAEAGSPMAELRKKNGREKPWHLKYLGVGNESWGCGGNMRPEYYSNVYRRYATFCHDYNGNKLYKVASGANASDYNWTRVLMERVGGRMDGLSLHYYTVGDWSHKGSATKFTDDDYYWTLGKCLEIEDLVKRHAAIMDSFDPKNTIGLLVDEWGTWWDEEPGTISGHLYQQNTLRDAFVASLSLDVFNRHTDRVRMANIAQIANVLQAMVLTKGDKMVLTPTYYVFRMYNVHQDATYLPIDITCGNRTTRDKRVLPTISATASRDAAGLVHISLSNVDLKEGVELTINLGGLGVTSVNSATILTSANISDYNTFDAPNLVAPKSFAAANGSAEAKISKNVLKLKLPAKSIVTLELK